MLLQRLSVRTTLTITIVVMGLLGLALALVTGEVYRRQALDNQRVSLVNLVNLKSHELLNDLASSARALGLVIQQDGEFREAYGRRDRAPLEGLLDSQFHQYFVTAEVLQLQRFQVFDLDLALVAESSDGDPELARGVPVCPALVATMRARKGHDRLQPASEICVRDGRPYFAVMVPIGGLRPAGYLKIVADPSFNLATLESGLGMPVRITFPSGRIAHQSKWWPAQVDARDSLAAEYALKGAGGEHALAIAVVSDIRSLHERLARTRMLVALAAGSITLVMVALALLVARRSALRPLLAIQDQVRNVRNSISSLRDSIASGEIAEETGSPGDFRSLTSEMHTLHNALLTMALSDTLTGLPNRLHLKEQLDKLGSWSRANQTPFAILVMDLDRFKHVNDSCGHDVGDQLLQQAASRLAGCLRRSERVAPGKCPSAEHLECEFLARIGGDEFAAILPGAMDRHAAETVVRRMIAALERPFTVGNRQFQVGVSIGIARCPRDSSDPITLLQLADQAMYDAKQRQCGYAFFEDMAVQRKAV